MMPTANKRTKDVDVIGFSGGLDHTALTYLAGAANCLMRKILPRLDNDFLPLMIASIKAQGLRAHV
jgi:hypothetical protein